MELARLGAVTDARGHAAAVLIVVLIVQLVERELFRSRDQSGDVRRAAVLGSLMWPLMAAFAVVVAFRMVALVL
jgi:hypothetical protein